MASAVQVSGLLLALSLSTSSAFVLPTPRSRSSEGTAPVVAAPTGHTLYATDPAGAVRFLDKFFNISVKVSSAAHAVKIGGTELRFVRAEHVGAIRAIEAAAVAWQKILDPQSPVQYSEWVDYHAGFGLDDYGPRAEMIMESDDALWLLNKWVLRVNIPGTIYSLEHHIRHDLPPGWVHADTDDACRNFTEVVPQSASAMPWVKNTYSSTDAASTSALMVRLFDAYVIQDPFPWPPAEGCEAARWVGLPNSTIQFHFVESQHAYPVDPDYNVSSYIASLHSKSEMSSFSNKLDFPSNVVDINVEDPVPLLERLAKGGDAYLARDEEEGCAIYTELVSTGFYIRAVHRGHDCDASAFVGVGSDGRIDGMCHVD